MILFVCTGNTCRSPMAEYLFRKLIKDYEVEIEVSSAGIYALEGNKASIYSQEVMKEIGVDITKHSSKKVDSKLMERANYVFTMTKEQAEILKSFYPKYSYKIYTLSDEDILDPYGKDIETYREVRDKIEKELKNLIKNIMVRVDL